MTEFTIRPILAAALCLFVYACATPPAPPARVALPAPPPVGEPSGIAGLQASQLRVAFGAPVFVRKDGTAELWRYDGATCKAFFFLYPEGNSLSVRHVETLPRGQDMAADSGCLNALRAHQQAAPTS
ncbi:MAG: hypothetical protein ABSC92_10830 [Rhizomicrobium sp.]|jgi:hypothetical protein